MVADKELPFPKKPSRCIVQKDHDGLHYIVAAEPLKDTTSPRIDVWWNRGPRKRIMKGNHPNVRVYTERNEELMIRQENSARQANGKVGADLLILTLGQVYDLIDALNQAVENP